MKTLILAVVAFIAMQDVSSAQKTKKQTTTTAKQPKLIYEVKSIEFVRDKDNPDQLIVRANGETNTAGWTSASLKPTFSVVKTEDGIYRFDFVALPPRSAENVAQVMTTVSAEYVFKSVPENLKSVIVYAEHNNMEKKYKETTALQSHNNMSCDGSKPGTLVFNSSGSYRIVLQRLEMGNREDAGLCISGTKSCWEHLQMFSVGSAIDINNVAEGSTLQIQSKQKNGEAPLNILMDDISCPPKEGYVYFQDSKGFRMQLKIEQTEQLSMVKAE